MYVGIVNEISFSGGNYRGVGEDIENCDVCGITVSGGSRVAMSVVKKPTYILTCEKKTRLQKIKDKSLTLW
ncbi:Hypothetical predicted protein [Octopus vulgaris]|uniref:Uncharacterized protein n=1 Tax=Octopus vulgaris TaxID=6645 RepID=A0AA36AP98_OCTVU|nr:Hypothetical predicted protein [Octopus vulgaris]